MDIKEFEKLKVGDKVKIVDKRTGTGWNPRGKMDKWLGKIMTIRDVEPYGLVKMREDAAENNDGWWWSSHMIDCKVDELATIEMHIIRGNKTVVRLSNGKVGVAKCDPQDSFDVYEGLRIAAARAYEKEPFADREDTSECAKDTAEYAKVRRVKRCAEAGEYVEIVKPDVFSTEVGLKKGQIRRVYRLSFTEGTRYVGTLPGVGTTLALIAPDEYVVLENYTGDEV